MKKLEFGFLTLCAMYFLNGSSVMFINCFDYYENLERWNTRRSEFLSKLGKNKHCLTETVANNAMRVINSDQSSAIGLPLDDAIRIEYEDWISEDWFPNDQELANMRLDDVM